tara:strand:- start:923 stop:1399 length:477 start_codon:yes stop_codon:yes gene_type:complete
MNIEYDNIDNKKCFCCERRLMEKEMHHFPKPKRYDGEMVIPLCIDCHDMADRRGLRHIIKEHEDYAPEAISGCTELAKNFILSVGILMAGSGEQKIMNDILPNWMEDYIETFQENEEDTAFKLLEGCSLDAKQLVMRIISRYYDIVNNPMGILASEDM